MKVVEVQQGYIVLSHADITGLTVDEKYKVMNIARVLKKHAKEFEEFIKDTQEKIPNTREQNAILDKEAEREINLEFDSLGKTLFNKLLEINKWNVTQAVLMEDLLV